MRFARENTCRAIETTDLTRRYGDVTALDGLSPNELLFDTPRFAVFGARSGRRRAPAAHGRVRLRETAPARATTVALSVSLAAGLVGEVARRPRRPALG